MKKPNIMPCFNQKQTACEAERQRAAGFTLIEVLVATTVFVIMLGLLMSIISHTSTVWRSGTQKISAFQNARFAFDRLTRQLGQATLNPYWEYDDPNNPQRYIRKSELHFRTGVHLLGSASHAVFFQCPAQRTGNAMELGKLDQLLNACGYFIDFVADDVPQPFQARTTAQSRFRLMQWMQDTEALSVCDPTAATPDDWYKEARSEAVPIADNIIALLFWPRPSTSDNTLAGWVNSYEYDSREIGTTGVQPIKQHQLPPIVQVVMVAMEKQSADRLGADLKTTIDEIMSDLFLSVSPTTADADMRSDLSTLETRLISRKISYRIFESAIALKEAKWSTQ